MAMISSPNARDLTSLWEQITSKHLRPEDDYEIAALLESLGWTDSRVQREMAMADVFELAQELSRFNTQPIGISVNRYKEKAPWWPAVRQYLGQFLRGMIFALPMVISIGAMLTLRLSLWSYQYLTTRTATAIAIGTLLSFLTVGGFMQAMARQGYFYMFQGQYRMMRRMTFRLIFFGIIASVLVSVTGFLLDILFPELPYDMLITSLAYYMVLNTIWLATAVLYILRKEIWFTLLLSAGIGLVYFGFRILRMNIVVVQILSMLVVVVSGFMLLRFFFHRIETKLDKGINPPMPRLSVTVYNVAPYFGYGALYFAMLFTDRVMAWSDHTATVPFIIWFRGDYELGLDFALLVLTLPMGMSEAIVSRLMTKIWTSQKDFLATDYALLNRSVLLLYRRSVFYMVIFTTLNAVGVYLAVRWILSSHLPLLQGLVQLNGIADEVFVVALVSYSILSIGLLHAIVMFSVSRPELVLRPMVAAAGLNLIVGFLLTRWISYPQAVWGLLTGCLCFLCLTTRNVKSVLVSLDYHMYLLS